MSKIWATPVWFFFHGFAEKVHEDFYKKNKQACLNIIKTICSALPCPMCRTAATKYMSRKTIKDIPTKEHFKKMLFDFHNSVNRKLGKRPFKRKELVIYKRLKFIKCTQIMCRQVRRFNRGHFNTPAMGNINDYINNVEFAVKKYLKYFI